jgi:hypothetical protein
VFLWLRDSDAGGDQVLEQPLESAPVRVSSDGPLHLVPDVPEGGEEVPAFGGEAELELAILDAALALSGEEADERFRKCGGCFLRDVVSGFDAVSSHIGSPVLPDEPRVAVELFEVVAE